MRLRTAFIFILFVLLFYGCKEDIPILPEVVSLPAPAPDTLRMVFAGDVMGHSTQNNGAWRDGNDSVYNFHPVYQYIQKYIRQADLAIANLEAPLGGAPYTGYPEFSSPETLAEALKWAGFDILMTANNHSLDKGKKGLERTIDALDSLGLFHTGTFKDLNDRQKNHPLFIEKNNFRIVFLNYTYGTNGKKVEKPNIVNYIDSMQILRDIIVAQEYCPHLLIAFMHWGDEYSRKYNRQQHTLARFMARNGIDLIIGAHPHVIQEFEYITVEEDSVPVLYSLGNFVSNQRERYKDGGILFEISYVKSEEKTRLSSWSYEPVWVHRYHSKQGYLFRLIPINDFLNDREKYRISFPDVAKMEQFYKDTKRVLHP